MRPNCYSGQSPGIFKAARDFSAFPRLSLRRARYRIAQGGICAYAISQSLPIEIFSMVIATVETNGSNKLAGSATGTVPAHSQIGGSAFRSFFVFFSTIVATRLRPSPAKGPCGKLDNAIVILARTAH